jgi:hypothetical protein
MFVRMSSPDEESAAHEASARIGKKQGTLTRNAGSIWNGWTNTQVSGLAATA